MFEQPAAKRVRRDELYSPPSSPRSSPDPELTDLFRSRLQQDYDIVPAQPVVESKAQDVGAPSDDEAELEFNLFAPTTTAAQPPTQKIRVRSPSPVPGEGGFLNGGRPKSYYFTGELSEARRREVESIAVEGEDILERSKHLWPGCSLPWKVRVIAPSGKVLQDPWLNAVEKEGKRRRAGKKARIAVRKKAEAQREKVKLRNMSAADKEAAEREKRTKRNREKKVKKKEREKAKKVGEVGEDSVDVPAGKSPSGTPMDES